jgi:putative membrane protein
MIVRPRPSALHLFFVRRGSIFPHIASKLLSITLLSCVVVGFYQYGLMQWLSHVSAPPFSLLGLALSVFLGFRNSACYDRWWEARKQWGELIIQARETQALLADDDDAGLRRLTIQRCIAFAHALAAHLRGQDAAAACAAWVGPDELAALRERRNVPDTLLNWIN